MYAAPARIVIVEGPIIENPDRPLRFFAIDGVPIARARVCTLNYRSLFERSIVVDGIIR